MSARSMNWLKFGGLVGLAFGLGLLFAGLLDLPRNSSAQQATSSQPPVVPTVNPGQGTQIAGTATLQNLSDAFASVAETVRPSVVFIKSTKTEKTAQGQRDPRIPQGMEPFFQLPRRNRPDFEQGTGSGFIVSADGYILTNNHVVEGADKVLVRLLDRREFVAKVVGADPNTDVAVVKIDAKNLQPAALGDSDNERVGEWVLAVGNPLGDGLTFTVTSGIISAKGRRLDGLQRSQLSIADFLQTDAAINPGNSGGPLVNVRGEVIGINSAIASETGFYSGYGFAIPINLARQVMTQLIQTGKVQRAALGVQIGEVTTADAQYVGLSEPYGIKISTLSDNSAAGKAGLEEGDIIIALNGKKMERVGQLQQEVGFKKPGEVVTIEVARKGGTRKTVKVTLQSLEDAQQVAQADQAGDDSSAGPAANNADAVVQSRLGVQVQAVDEQAIRELGLPRGTTGVVVTDVVPGSPAFDLGMIPAGNGGAFVILSVEGQPVRTPAELRNILKAQKSGAIVTLRLLRQYRGQGTRSVDRVQLSDSQ